MKRCTDAQIAERVRSIARAGSGCDDFGRQAYKSADAVYAVLAGDAGLYGVAFFGHRGTRAEHARLRRCWKRALRIAQCPATEGGAL